MKLDFSFGCMGWKVEFFTCFFFFFFPPPLGIQSPCVCVSLRTCNEEWQSTYEETLCTLSLIPILEASVTREDTHTRRTFRYQLQFGQREREDEKISCTISAKITVCHKAGMFAGKAPRALWMASVHTTRCFHFCWRSLVIKSPSSSSDLSLLHLLSHSLCRLCSTAVVFPLLHTYTCVQTCLQHC